MRAGLLKKRRPTAKATDPTAPASSTIPTTADDRPRPRPRPSVTGLVICFNEEANIGGCLDSLEWCDEIIVVDSFSTDRTPEIARRYETVRFHQRRYRGGAGQRNWALGLVKTDWVFVLDADERCPPALRQEIEELLSGDPPPSEAYTVGRRCYFLGRPIRFSGWRNDRVIRLFRRGAGYYNNRRVHEEVVTARPAPLLRHRLDHFLIDSFDDYVRRINLYGYWGAAQYWRDGRYPSPAAQVLLRTPWRFVRTYVVQLGFLDGMHGLVFCILQTYATYLKWSLLWSWHQDAKRGRQPVLPEFDDDPAVWSGLAAIQSDRAGRKASPSDLSPRPAVARTPVPDQP